VSHGVGTVPAGPCLARLLEKHISHYSQRLIALTSSENVSAGLRSLASSPPILGRSSNLHRRAKGHVSANGYDNCDLPVIPAAWPELPETIRAGIVGMVKAASPER
jgi:hypothetical protein